jgi:uncharacterized protein
MLGLWIVSLILMAIGLAGTVIPGLPGTALVLAGIALFTLGTGFELIGPIQFGLMVLLGLVGIGLDLVGNLVGARRFGASRRGLIGALLGLIPGLFLAGPFGLVLGPLVGAILFELLGGRELRSALRSGAGVVVGYLFGALAEVIIALILAGWFLVTTFGPVTGGAPAAPTLPPA